MLTDIREFTGDVVNELKKKLKLSMRVVDKKRAKALGKSDDDINNIINAVVNGTMSADEYESYIERDSKIITELELTAENVCGNVEKGYVATDATDNMGLYNFMCIVDSTNKKTQEALGERYGLLVDNLWILLSSTTSFGATCASLVIGKDGTSNFFCYSGLDPINAAASEGRKELFQSVVRDSKGAAVSEYAPHPWRGWRAKWVRDITYSETGDKGWLHMGFHLFTSRLENSRYDDGPLIAEVEVAKDEVSQVNVVNVSNPYSLVFLFDKSEAVGSTSGFLDEVGLIPNPFTCAAFSSKTMWLPRTLPWIVGTVGAQINETVPAHRRVGNVSISAQIQMLRIGERGTRVWLFQGAQSTDYNIPVNMSAGVDLSFWDMLDNADKMVSKCEIREAIASGVMDDVVELYADVLLSPVGRTDKQLSHTRLVNGEEVTWPAFTKGEIDGTEVELKGVSNEEIIIDNLRGREFTIPLTARANNLLTDYAPGWEWSKAELPSGEQIAGYDCGFVVDKKRKGDGSGYIYTVNKPELKFGGEDGLLWWTFTGAKALLAEVADADTKVDTIVVDDTWYGKYDTADARVQAATSDAVVASLWGLGFLDGYAYPGAMWHASPSEVSLSYTYSNDMSYAVFKDPVFGNWAEPDVNWGFNVRLYHSTDVKSTNDPFNGNNIVNPTADIGSTRRDITINLTYAKTGNGVEGWAPSFAIDKGFPELDTYGRPRSLIQGNFVSLGAKSLDEFGNGWGLMDKGTDPLLRYKVIQTLDCRRPVVAFDKGRYARHVPITIGLIGGAKAGNSVGGYSEALPAVVIPESGVPNGAGGYEYETSWKAPTGETLMRLPCIDPAGFFGKWAAKDGDSYKWAYGTSTTMGVTVPWSDFVEYKDPIVGYYKGIVFGLVEDKYVDPKRGIITGDTDEEKTASSLKGDGAPTSGVRWSLSSVSALGSDDYLEVPITTNFSGSSIINLTFNPLSDATNSDGTSTTAASNIQDINGYLGKGSYDATGVEPAARANGVVTYAELFAITKDGSGQFPGAWIEMFEGELSWGPPIPTIKIRCARHSAGVYVFEPDWWVDADDLDVSPNISCKELPPKSYIEDRSGYKYVHNLFGLSEKSKSVYLEEPYTADVRKSSDVLNAFHVSGTYGVSDRKTLVDKKKVIYEDDEEWTLSSKSFTVFLRGTNSPDEDPNINNGFVPTSVAYNPPNFMGWCLYDKIPEPEGSADENYIAASRKVSAVLDRYSNPWTTSFYELFYGKSFIGETAGSAMYLSTPYPLTDDEFTVGSGKIEFPGQEDWVEVENDPNNPPDLDSEGWVTAEDDDPNNPPNLDSEGWVEVTE